MIHLPIDPLIPEILDLLREKDQVILTATPGAGKTTRLPPELLNVVPGKIAILEPRRMATVAASQRVAEERSWSLGQQVGYQVRFESKMCKETRLVFMTDALLLRRLVDDPELNEFDMIVIDEFHERNLNQDILLGVIKELQELGRKIKLLIMSATLDVVRLQEYLPLSAHIDVPGKVFPLTVRHISQPLRPTTDPDFFNKVVESTATLARENPGDILVFLPGIGEIHRVQEMLESKNLQRDIFPLHGSLTLQEQKEILKPHDRARIVLATNIAEASVTVPGVDCVVDSGLSKIMEVNLNSGFSRLELTRIAKFNARQRSGRAARQKNGICLRLWTAHEESTQNEEMVPEVQRVDLSQTLLLLSHLGITDFANFSWFDSPPPALLKMAMNSLKSLKALDDKNRLTELGKKLMLYPLPPRLGSLLALSEELNVNTTSAARAAALLQDKDILIGRSEAASGLDCDILYRLQLLDEFENQKNVSGLNKRQAQTVLETAEQLERLTKKSSVKKMSEDDIHKLLLLSQSDRLCARRGNTDRAVMVGGRGVRIAKESQLKNSPFFLSLQGVDLPGQSESLVSMACGLEKQFVLDTLKDQIVNFEDVYFDEAKGQFYQRRTRRFKDLDLDEPRLTPIKVEDLGERFVEALIGRWDWIVANNESLKDWMSRWKFFVKLDSAMENELTAENVSQALNFAAFNKTKISDVLNEDLVRWLESTMDKNTIKSFHTEVPSRFQAPSGQSHKIHYSEIEDPYAEVRLQEMFGTTQTPKVGFGKKPLIFKLLAPNFRPVQVTSDIASFWKNTYFEVRKELRSRYPKHSWPDDPLTAIPVAQGRRRH